MAVISATSKASEWTGCTALRVKMYVSDPGGATTIWVDFPAQKAKTLPGWVRQLVED